MTSALELFRIGIGPSSSHTVGPMRAARAFALSLAGRGLLPDLAALRIELYGSLASTGPAHGTIGAVLAGLEGHEPDQVDPSHVATLPSLVRTSGQLRVLGGQSVPVDLDGDIHLDPVPLTAHPNGMIFTARDARGRALATATWYSIGGGFVREEGVDDPTDADHEPYTFASADELLQLCATRDCSISSLVLANETARRSEEQLRAGILAVWRAMAASIEAGLRGDGTLPGILAVKRRAPELYRRWCAGDASDGLEELDRVVFTAMAVNEENAAGGRVVTAPTNGAAGIIPAVLDHHLRTATRAGDDDVVRFLLTATAIGSLCKRNASISGAEVGCQGEVGSACAMAAAGLTEVLGGTPHQVENAAEIGLEHNLGLTCDPVAGLVQIPCIERNGIAAVKAVTAARMALHGDGHHRVSLDQAITTLRTTGADMADKYKETSRGGLAVNVPEC